MRRIVEFARGFPLMAVLLAKARLEGTMNLGSVADDYLVDRLLWGSKPPNEEARRAITGCAIFEQVGFDGERANERHFVADEVSRVDREQFYGIIKGFMARGIVERGGQLVRLRPLPLAIRLAADWWRACSPERAQELITKVPEPLAQALCDRMAMLDFLPEAQDAVRELCGEQGPFGRAEVLSSEGGSRLFRSLVEANPQDTAGALTRAFAGWTREQLLTVGPGRRNLVWALEKLCFWQETFPSAARLLLRFAAAENELWDNNATGQFIQLYQAYLSGTQAPPSARLAVIDDARPGADRQTQTVMVMALSKGLSTRGFSRTVGVEMQGSGVPRRDWQPASAEDLLGYWRECLSRLTETACSGSELAGLARGEIAEAISGLLTQGLIDEVRHTLEAVTEAHGACWPEALESIRWTARSCGKECPEKWRGRVVALEEILQPKSLSERLTLVVSSPPDDFQEDDRGEYVDLAAKNASAFAEECAEAPDELLQNLATVLVGPQSAGYPFGLRLGQCLADPASFIDRACTVLRGVPPDKGNPTVLGAFFRSLRARNEALVEESLDRMAEDGRLSGYVTAATQLANPTERDLSRVAGLLEQGQTSAKVLHGFSYGDPLGHLAPQPVTEFVSLVAKHGGEGARAALHILMTYTSREPDKWEACRQQMRDILLLPGILMPPKELNVMDDYRWRKMCERLLDDDHDSELAQAIAEQIARVCDGGYSHNLDKALKAITGLLLARYSEAAWSILSEVLVSDNGVAVLHMFHLLGGGLSRQDETGVLLNLPEDQLKQWCRERSAEAPQRIAHIMPLFAPVEEERVTWHPFARWMLDEFGDRDDVLSEVSCNLHTYFVSGPLEDFLAKQVAPLEELAGHALPRVRRWAAEELEWLHKDIARERIKHEERAWGR